MGRDLAIKMILKIIKIKMQEKQNKTLPLSADLIESKGREARLMKICAFQKRNKESVSY